jgi:hypothetical protein
MLLMIPFFLAYILFFITRGKSGKNIYELVFIISLLINFGSLTYAQFLFSWESSYFDGIVTRNIKFPDYVRAKYYLMILFNLTVFIPLFLVFFHTKQANVFLPLALLVFNIGITNFIALLFAAFNDGRIDLSKSRLLNYQGIKASQFLLSFVFMLIPLGIFALFNYLFGINTALILITTIGITAISVHSWWINNIIIIIFQKRKYKNLDGFRRLTF